MMQKEVNRGSRSKRYSEMLEDEKRAVKIKEYIKIEIKIAEKTKNISNPVNMDDLLKEKLEILNELDKLMEGKEHC